MKPEELAKRLAALPGLGLVSVILYGSAASGDHAGRGSDYNILVVLDRIGRAELDRMAPVARAWARAGNPPPLVFTEEQLRRSADVFPIELTDMRERHVVLHGADVVAPLSIVGENARLHLEHEVKGRLIRLRQGYLLAGGRPRRVRELMTGSISGILSLGRAAVRLMEGRAPATKREVIEPLTARMQMDPEVLRRVLDAKEGRAPIASREAVELFDRYIQSLEAMAWGIDTMVPPRA